MEGSPYKKEVGSLNESEKDLLSTSRAVLADGNKLYGIDGDEIGHIEYAVGLVISSLKELFEEDGINTILEIGYDSDGFYVSFPFTAEDMTD